MQNPLTVRLSDFVDRLQLAVIRDAEFRHAGKIATRLDAMIVPLVDPDYAPQIVNNARIAGVITTAELAPLVPEHLGLAIAARPMEIHSGLHALLCDIPGLLWTSFPTEMGANAAIDSTAWVPPADVRIGKNVRIARNVTIHPRTIIGDDVCIRENSTIGSDAYEIVKVNGQQRLRPQAGGVRIGNGVEILPGVSISRAAFGGFSEIHDRVVIDNMSVLSHDVDIGADTRIGGLSWIGGRVRVGREAVIGPKVTIANGIVIGDRGHVSLGAVVTRDVGAGEHVSGNFAIPHDKFIAFLRTIR